jgi:hypothetical protein
MAFFRQEGQDYSFNTPAWDGAETTFPFMSLLSGQTRYDHIILDKAGIPSISGTDMKVIEPPIGATGEGCNESSFSIRVTRHAFP